MRVVLLAILLPLLSVAQTVTWSEQIAPIIYNNCSSCHHAGQVTPFTLMSYDDVARHAPTVAAVTRSGYMPPWKPEPGWMAFRDERRLSASQISLIQQWVAAGAPQGDLSKAPAPPSFPDGWQLGPPDLILQMPKAFSVPADGSDIYRNFVLPTGLTDDHWIKAIELRPSARSAVHHVLFSSDASGQARSLDGQDGQPGFAGFGAVFTLGLSNPATVLSNPSLIASGLAGGLGGWVPGTTPEFLPAGIAYSLPKGADLILQTHFHPDGKAEAEQTTVGIYFAPQPPREITQVQSPAFFGVRANIDIPAGKSDYMVRGSFTLPVAVDAFSVSAHAHNLARQTRISATLPSGEVKILLSIPDWNFSWQDTYIFKDLLALPAGTRIDGELIYDNSADNPNNPFSPPREVKWGENSIDEMGSLILNVVPHQQSDGDALRAAVVAYVIASTAQVGSKPLFISSGVIDGASAQPVAVTPGKIVVLYGNRMAPAAPASAQVLFDGTPAPILYSSANQVGAIAPYSLQGKLGTQVQIRNGSLLSDKVALPVAPVGPSIFSLDYSGIGQGAILNQDNVTVNSYTHPADKGSIISIYSTGEGQTNPAGVDGKIAAGPDYPKPLLPVQVNIGGLPAEVLYYGAAPTLIAGVMQVNARIPMGVPSGDVTVELVMGGAKSRPGITVAVK